VEYIASRIAEAHKVSYPSDEIRAVLHLEAEYLGSIGAVGEPVDGFTIDDGVLDGEEDVADGGEQG
jgi:hypothetical protein